jgi:hypothetical protein
MCIISTHVFREHLVKRMIKDLVIVVSGTIALTYVRVLCRYGFPSVSKQVLDADWSLITPNP